MLLHYRVKYWHVFWLTVLIMSRFCVPCFIKFLYCNPRTVLILNYTWTTLFKLSWEITQSFLKCRVRLETVALPFAIGSAWREFRRVWLSNPIISNLVTYVLEYKKTSRTRRLRNNTKSAIQNENQLSDRFRQENLGLNIATPSVCRTWAGKMFSKTLNTTYIIVDECRLYSVGHKKALNGL